MGTLVQNIQSNIQKIICNCYMFIERYTYPLIKFLIFFWLIPLIQLFAWIFDFKRPKPTNPVVVIVNARSNTVPSSFFSLIPKLEEHSIKVNYHVVGYVDLIFFKKIFQIFYFFRSSQHADFVFLDDSFLPISYALKYRWLFKPRVVQLWHSAGLFKRVGLHICQDRLLSFLMKKNYAKFDVVVVSSEACRDVIANFMGLEKSKVVALGTSYTDRYPKELMRSKSDRSQSFKKNVVYAPTFRGEPHKVKPSPVPEVHDVFLEVGNRFNCYISTHPHDPIESNEFEYPFVLSDSLSQIDILITDYSSIAMDYILANPQGTLILFVPDFKKFQLEVGFYVPLNEITKYVAYDKTELLFTLTSSTKPYDYSFYKDKYLTLCDGRATDRLLEFLDI